MRLSPETCGIIDLCSIAMSCMLARYFFTRIIFNSAVLLIISFQSSKFLPFYHVLDIVTLEYHHQETEEHHIKTNPLIITNCYLITVRFVSLKKL
jgi:hypothetical protein